MANSLERVTAGFNSVVSYLQSLFHRPREALEAFVKKLGLLRGMKAVASTTAVHPHSEPSPLNKDHMTSAMEDLTRQAYNPMAAQKKQTPQGKHRKSDDDEFEPPAPSRKPSR